MRTDECVKLHDAVRKPGDPATHGKSQQLNFNGAGCDVPSRVTVHASAGTRACAYTRKSRNAVKVRFLKFSTRPGR